MGEDLVIGHEEANSNWKKLVEKESKWIKVTDRLPEELVPVLFIIGMNASGDSESHVGYLKEGEWHLQLLYDEDMELDRNNRYYRAVTHWQPLPEPPKE